MFGKGRKKMSSTDRFIMGAGRSAGNLKAAKPFTPPKAGKNPPVKVSPDPVRNRPLSPGQVNTFKTRGR